MAEEQSAEVNGPAAPVVISARRLSTGVIRALVRGPDGIEAEEDGYPIAATGLPPVELPIGRMVAAFVEGGGKITDDATAVPAVANFASATPPVGEPAPLPPAATPVLSARQLRLWLVRNGIKLADVDKALDGLPEDQQDEARIEWEYATEYRRDNHLIELVAVMLKLSDAEVDAGFAVAVAY